MVMNELTSVTTIQNSQAKYWVKISAIRVGSAVKYGALFSVVYTLLTGIPVAVVTIAIGHRVIDFFAPVIRLFHGSAADILSRATTTTLLILLFYVLGSMLFFSIFTALAALVYNLVARFTGGLTLELREVSKKREDGPSQVVIRKVADGASSKETPAATGDTVSDREDSA
jgi:hypothetical protein